MKLNHKHALIDHRIGESRAVIFDDQGQAFELFIHRWLDQSPYQGEVHRGIIKRIEDNFSAAFIELERGVTGFLPLSKSLVQKKGLFQGTKIIITIKAEAHSDKLPILEISDPSLTPSLPETHCLESLMQADLFKTRFERYLKHYYEKYSISIDLVRIEDQDKMDCEDIDDLFDHALSAYIPLSDQGGIWIEKTHALTAIDIDHGRGKGTHFQQGIIKRNLEALSVIERQIRLRRISGLIVIDFITIHNPKARHDLFKAIQSAFNSHHYDHKLIIAPLSQFCLCELSRERLKSPLSEIMLNQSQQKTSETLALEAIHKLYQAGLVHKKEYLYLIVHKEIMNWLETTALNWKQILETKFGNRFAVQSRSNDHRDKIEIICEQEWK